MPRSLKVSQEYIVIVKAAVQRQGYPRQKDLAEDLAMSRDTVRKFLNGYPVDYLNFIEICDRLGQDRKLIAATNINTSNGKEARFDLFADEPEVESFIDVERQSIETVCYQTLSQPGALLRIKAPGLMGKTVLMTRVVNKLRREGNRTVCLNLGYTEQEDLSNLNSFLRWFCISVGELLGLPNCLDKYWNEKLPNKMNCFGYFQRYLLPQAESPLVICIDEVEQLFNHPVVGREFLVLLRAWHETAKTIPIWKQLRLVVVHSTENYIQLNINESPFNVGVPIELPEFTPQEVQTLAQKYGLDWEVAQVNQLMALVGGHPFLGIRSGGK